MYNRSQLVEAVKGWAIANKNLLAAWEGGSAATGRLDQYSDLDLYLVVEKDVEVIFTSLEEFLVKKFGIFRKFRIPEPAWHGLSQCFYVVNNVAPLVYMDVAVIKRDAPDKYMQRDRHGDAIVWFDHAGIYNHAPSSKEDVVNRGKAMYASAISTDFLNMLEVEKGLKRGHFLDVFPPFYGFVQRQLVVMLNLKYRPERADFGLRYGRLDYGKDDVKLVEDAIKASSVEEIEKAYQRVKARYLQLVDELAATWK